MASAERPLQAVPQPPDEPVVVTIPDGRNIVVRPEQEESWLVACAWQDEKHARELAERDLRSKRALIQRLRDDQDAKRKAYGKRDVIERLFERWQQASNHTRSLLGPERFDPCRARLEQGYTEEQLTMAVMGVALNPHIADNGERHDEFEIAVRSGKQVEHYAKRCPVEVRRQIRAEFAAGEGEQMAIA